MRDGSIFIRDTRVAIISNSATIRVIREAYRCSPYRAAMLAAGRMVHLTALVALCGEHDAGRLISREMAIELGRGRLLR
jgi:hypothetical protein